MRLSGNGAGRGLRIPRICGSLGGLHLNGLMKFILVAFECLNECLSVCFCCLNDLEARLKIILIELMVVLDGISKVEDDWFG